RFEEFGLAGLQWLAIKPKCQQSAPRLNDIAWNCINLLDDAGQRRHDALIAFAASLDHYARHLNRSTIGLGLKRLNAQAEIGLRLATELYSVQLRMRMRSLSAGNRLCGVPQEP